MQRLVVALVTLLGLTGAAVVAAYLLVFAAGTDRAARLAPADTVAYATVYLQPSTGQQMNLGQLLGRFPGFADASTLDAKVDQIVHNLLAGTGIDYREQIKPWLGDQLALAVVPAGDGMDGAPVVIAEVKDRELAGERIPELAASAGQSFTTEQHAGVDVHVSDVTAYAFVDDMVVLGPDAAGIEAVIDVSNGADALAGHADFQRAMADMPPDHLAAAFADLAGIAATTGVEDRLDGLSTAAAVLVADPDGLRLSGTAPFAIDEAAPSARAGFAMGGEPSSLVDWMPADTVAEVVVFGLRQALEDAEAAVGEVPEGQEVVGMLDTIRALAAFGLGIDLDADVLPLLDREVAVAVSGFEGDMPTGQLLLRPDDAQAAAEAVERLADGLVGLGADSTTREVGAHTITTLALPDIGEVAYTQSNGIVIIGLGDEQVIAALEAHDSGRSLGSSEAYRRSFDLAGERAGNEGWVDVQALLGLLGDSVPTTGDARDMLDQLGSLAFTAPSRDEHIAFHVVLTVD